MKKVKGLILEEFKKIAEDLDEKELLEIKEKLVGNYYISQEDSQGQMVNLLVNELEGDAKYFYEFEKNIRSVKLSDVKEIAKKAISNFSFLALVPEWVIKNLQSLILRYEKNKGGEKQKSKEKLGL